MAWQYTVGYPSDSLAYCMEAVISIIHFQCVFVIVLDTYFLVCLEVHVCKQLLRNTVCVLPVLNKATTYLLTYCIQ